MTREQRKNLENYKFGGFTVTSTNLLILISELEGSYQQLKYLGFKDDMETLEEIKGRYYKLYFKTSKEEKLKMKLLTLEDYEKAGESFWPKYWYVAKELGEDAKAEDIIKVLESIGTVALRIKMEEKEGPFGFNKKADDETENGTEETDTSVNTGS